MLNGPSNPSQTALEKTVVIRQNLIPAATAKTAQGIGIERGSPSRRRLRLQTPLGLLVLPECRLVPLDQHSAMLTSR